MHVRNPLLTLNQELSDYEAYLLEAEGDSPLNRIFVVFIVLFTNLIIGFAFTVLCFKLKGCVTKVIRLACCCGLFCSDCDCDYDGSYPSRRYAPPSRPIRRRYKRRSSQAQEALNEDEVFVEETAEDLLSDCKECLQATTTSVNVIYHRCSSGRKGKQFLMFFFGVVSCLWWSHGFTGNWGRVEPITLIHSVSSRQILSRDESSRVYFITPTIMSGIQVARLTRLAQALFPHRKFVTWVIVSTDPVQSTHWSGRRTEHWSSSSQISQWEYNVTRVNDHLEDLREVVGRFGIPFVILSGHVVHHRNKGFHRLHRIGQTAERQVMMANYIGLTWLTNTFSRGTFLFGHEDGAFISQLFREVQDTREMSTWPSFAQSRYFIGIHSPTVRSHHSSEITGHFEGGQEKPGNIPFRAGSFALKIPLLRPLKKRNELWKLTLETNGDYSSKDLGIQPSDVQCLHNCSQILMWKLCHTFSHMRGAGRKKIPLKYDWTDTNVGHFMAFVRKWFALDLIKFLN